MRQPIYANYLLLAQLSDLIMPKLGICQKKLIIIGSYVTVGASMEHLSSIKLMEETDVALQIYSFLDVMVVRYDEKPTKMDKDVISVIS